MRWLRVGSSWGIAGGQGYPDFTNGATLTVGATDWSAIAYSSNALMVVETGGAASFAYQLWIGFNPGADGVLTMNGGTVSVVNMFGLGWNGGKGTANIHGGTLSLNQWNPTQSISGASVLDVAGTGKVVITGDQTLSISNYVVTGNITGSPGVYYGYNPITGKTTISTDPGDSSGVTTDHGGNSQRLQCVGYLSDDRGPQLCHSANSRFITRLMGKCSGQRCHQRHGCTSDLPVSDAGRQQFNVLPDGGVLTRRDIYRTVKSEAFAGLALPCWRGKPGLFDFGNWFGPLWNIPSR